ncbi:hypothetical protein GEMRC1_000145 [Eukaryota sp. GEM-RC1]
MLETIDFGKDDVRSIVSGIAHHVSPSDLIGKKVLCVVNLREALMAGHKSQGMLLCAKNSSEVTVPIYINDDVAVGSKVAPLGVLPAPKKQLKSKDWTLVQSKLVVKEFKVYFDELPMVINGTDEIVSTVENSPIS